MALSLSSLALEILPLRTPTLPPATHTNCYLLGRRELLVVDPGPSSSDDLAPVVERIRELVEEGASVVGVLLTHHHGDHLGGAVELAERFDAPLFAHPETARLAGFDDYRPVSEGDLFNLDGEEWRALHTPGHAPGHVVLFNEAGGELIAGDMVAGEGTILLDPDDGDLALYLASLERLQGLAARAIHPAHGGVLGPEILGEYISHRHMRTGQIESSLGALGEATPEALVAHVYPELHPMAHGLAARQILCHLLWLEGRGRARAVAGEWAPAG